MSRRKEILASIELIPSMPAAAIEAIALLQDPDVDIGKLMQTIEYDPGLTSNLLRLANSAYYGGAQTISSLRDAIVRLGTKCILQMVVASAASPLVRPALAGYDLPPGALWKHSVAVAVGAEQVAAAVGIPAPENAFTSGLLHDVGKILLGTFMEVDVEPIVHLAKTELISFDVAEQRVLGIDHAEAGAALLEAWELPELIIRAIRWHHTPEDYEGDPLVVDLVHVADALCLQGAIGAGGADGLQYRSSREVVQRIGLTTLAAETAVCGIMQGLSDLGGLFDDGAGVEAPTNA
jgi:putative nucleotidyltransferase with HDIG domain